MNRDSVVTRQNSSPLPLAFKAGPLALDVLQREGLSPHTLGAVAGAAGGPKWLVLAAMDKLIFGSWLAQRKTPLPLIGSSIGSWRFAAATQKSPVDAIMTLARLYIEQQYSDHPTITEVTEVARHIVEQLLGNNGAEATLGHDWARINIVTAHCQGATGSDERARLVMGFSQAFLANMLSRDRLSQHLHRHVFADPRHRFTHEPFPGFNTRMQALTPNNLTDALLASGSIPFVLEKICVSGNDGYRDGGLIDYHMDLPLADEGIVLMPHFSKRCVTGWLDKNIPWRRPSAMGRHLVICPTDEWIATLPNSKIPDRSDFKRYRNQPDQRIRDWQEVLTRSQELADCLADRIVKNDWLDHVHPL